MSARKAHSALPTDERTQDDDQSDRVQSLGLESPPPGVVSGRQATDDDADRDHQPVPGNGDRPDLDRRVDADRDYGRNSTHLRRTVAAAPRQKVIT